MYLSKRNLNFSTFADFWAQKYLFPQPVGEMGFSVIFKGEIWLAASSFSAESLQVSLRDSGSIIKKIALSNGGCVVIVTLLRYYKKIA